MHGVLLTTVLTAPSCHCILGQKSAVSYHCFISVSIVTELSRKQRLPFLHENRALAFPHSPVSSLWKRSHRPIMYRLLTTMVLVHSRTVFLPSPIIPTLELHFWSKFLPTQEEIDLPVSLITKETHDACSSVKKRTH